MARIQPPQRVHGERVIQLVQDSIHRVLRDVCQHEQLTGVMVRGVTLTTTPQTIAHGLGRQPIGWSLSDKQDAGDVYRTAWDERSISLRTAAGTVRGDFFIW